MSVLQPVSRISHWLLPIGAGITQRSLFRFLSCWWSPQLDLDSTSVPGDVDCCLRPGTLAPNFTLPRIGGGDCSLSDYHGRRVLLAFLQPDYPHSGDIAARLNHLHRSGKLSVLVVSRGTPYETVLWADEVLAAFPVLVSSDPGISPAYDVSNTPCAYEIDERGLVFESGAIRL